MKAPTILLVEDNRLLRWWLSSSLQNEGFMVSAPQLVDEAIVLAGSTPFDVLITDWRLPEGHDGLELLDRAREKDPDVLAVLISAEADAEFSGRAREKGFDFVVAKPFPVQEIVNAVHSLAERIPASVAS